jgi:hypothetical protein
MRLPAINPKGSRGAENAQPIRPSADAAAPGSRDDEPMQAAAPIVDLAERHTHDLDVVLLWARRSGRVWVEVTHRSSGRTGRISANGLNALDVFHHPFAYAVEPSCI